MRFVFRGLAVFCLVSGLGCVSVDSSPGSAEASAGPSASGIALSEADAAAIGRKIWENECNGTVEGLTSWNAGEDFPSLGIGHFIWYVEGRRGPFEESFPRVIDYMERQGVRVPAWVAGADGSPWRSRDDFLAARDSTRMKELRSFLANTVPEQTGFIVRRLEMALPKMTRETEASERGRLQENFHDVASTRTGIYALIDYVNFKGEGVNPEERYRGEGWGLRDVLLEMNDTRGGRAAAVEFSGAAKRVLRRRIENSPPSRGESRWREGWMNRCESYKRGL